MHTNYASRFLQPARMTYKSAATDKYILGVRKETQAKILSLQIINKDREQLKWCKQLTVGFSDSVAACTTESREKDDNGLPLTADIC
jgi:hypothetical protein